MTVIVTSDLKVRRPTSDSDDVVLQDWRVGDSTSAVEVELVHSRNKTNKRIHINSTQLKIKSYYKTPLPEVLEFPP